MTDRELMQQALEALNRSDYLGWQVNIPIIKALRERLAQQEPVAWRHDCAALCTNDVELWIDHCPHCGKPSASAPPRREWQGLTQEEKAAIYQQADEEDWHDQPLLEAVEAKLKEKNA